MARPRTRPTTERSTRPRTLRAPSLRCVSTPTDGCSFAGAWRTVAVLRPDRTAVVCGEDRRSFGELNARANQLGHVLRAAGVGPDDKVAIMCVNSPEYLEAFFAAQKL